MSCSATPSGPSRALFRTFVGLAASVWTAAISFPLLATSCSSDDGSPNILPMPQSTSTSADVGDDVTDGEFSLPRAYRFDCVDIQRIGNADEGLQLSVLENTWTNDINNYKLNIVMSVLERDEESKTATLGIGSGVGSSPSDLCHEAGSLTDPYQITYDPEVAVWTRSDGQGCAMAASTDDAHGGTYSIELGADELIYVYAEDNDGTHFNCTPDPAQPNAVPVRALHAEVTANAAGNVLAGVLTGCLVETEAESLCSCLGACAADGPGDLEESGECQGCPRGSTPLRTMLGSIGPSERCTQIVGAPAFDLTIGFTTVALPSVPDTCS